MALLKARDIENELKSRGFERGTLYVLQTLAEQHAQHHKDLMTLARYFDQMVNSMDGMMNVAGAMKEALDKIGREKAEPDLGPNTQGLGN